MEFTQEEFEEVQQRLRENAARDRRYKKEGNALAAERAALVAQINALRAEVCEIDSEIAENRQDRHENQSAGLALPAPVRWQGYDAAPEGEKIADLAAWSHELRRRAWGAAFVDMAFSGKKGTSDLMLLLSLGHLMETQGTRIIEADIPEIVRVSAMDYKTVAAHMGSLRASGYLLRIAVHSYVLVADKLPAFDKFPDLLTGSLADRLVMGDRCDDSFGGRHGLGPTEIRVWVWLLLNLGATRYAIAKGAGVGMQTAYNILKTLNKRGLAKVCEESGNCYALDADKCARVWLEQYVVSNKKLEGAAQARVNRAIQPQHHQGRTAASTKRRMAQEDETRITNKAELDFE